MAEHRRIASALFEEIILIVRLESLVSASSCAKTIATHLEENNIDDIQ